MDHINGFFGGTGAWIALLVTLSHSVSAGATGGDLMVVRPPSTTAFWAEPTISVPLEVFLPPETDATLEGEVFLTANQLAAPVPQHAASQELKGEPSIVRNVDFPVNLPEVERETEFVLRLTGKVAGGETKGEGIIRLEVYPKAILGPLREAAATSVPIFVAGQCEVLDSFLENNGIPFENLGPTLPDNFADRGVLLYCQPDDEEFRRPVRMDEGQVLIAFEKSVPNRVTTVSSAPFDQGILVRVKGPEPAKIAADAASQKFVADLILESTGQTTPNQ